MTKKEIKERAQDKIMLYACHAFTEQTEQAEIRIEMEKQLKRIEKLFGYEVGSWKRGC
jgi:hypothetical protein